MPVSPGGRLGAYEIVGLLGAGGMGEVYRARDSKLRRDVALKILPERFAADPDRRTRFTREAYLLASLNHPNIAAIYGIEEDEGTTALVLELVEGPTLADRIARGAVPLDDAVKIATQLADALDAAHERGIVHRDLKPANIKVTDDGRVKVLDFGLAKALIDDSSPDASISPTVTRQGYDGAGGTEIGVVLGTAAYMSPEQAKGKPVDKRTDIWAFGCVIYEMLTGTRAFADDDVTDLIVSVMTKEPDWTRLPASTPPRSVELLRRCLQKDPRERLRDVGDARLEIDAAFRESDARAGSSRETVTSLMTARRRTIAVPVAVGLLAAGAAGMAVWTLARRDAAPLPPTHIPLSAPSGVTLFYDREMTTLAVSPNGRQLVYAGASQGRRLYLQDLDKPGAAVPIAGTEGGLNPFFSSDGTWLAFVANNTLQKVALGGGAPVKLADASRFKGGAWSPDDETIYFVPHLDTGIWKVSARGGAPSQITTPDRDGYDGGHWWPAILPGGRRLLYTSCCGRDRIMALDLVTGQRTLVIENGFFATYVSTRHLVFAQGHSLLSAGFDPDSLKVANPVKLLDTVVTGYEKHAQYAVSTTGTFVYFEGVSDSQRTLVRIDRNGAIGPLAGPRGYSTIMRLAPDGRRLALTTYEAQTDVFVYDLQRNDFDRVTLDPHNDFWAVWTPDGRSLVFTSIRRGPLDLYVGPVDKSRPEELLYASDHPKFASSWSPDGRLLAFTEERAGRGLDIWIYSVSEQKARPFREGSFNEDSPHFSPDGRWIAYMSDEVGAPEIYVTPYPGPGPTCKVSTSGGAEPRWSADGKEIFYRRGSAAMVADVADRRFCAANPRVLFDRLEPGLWDVSPNGDFFVTLAPREPPRLRLVLNWFEELKRLTPALK